MRDIKYPVKCFRLSNETYNRLAKLRGDDLSWNLFFVELIRLGTGNVCTICGSPKKVQEHHIKAIRDGGVDTKENKRLLCFKCHKLTHNWGNKK